MLLGSKPVEEKTKKQRQAEGGVGLWGISMKLQRTPWKTLNLGWPFKPVSSWGKKDRTLYCYVIGGKLLQKDAIGWGDALQPRLFSKRTDNCVLYRQYFLVGTASSWETKSLIPKRGTDGASQCPPQEALTGHLSPFTWLRPCCQILLSV